MVGLENDESNLVGAVAIHNPSARVFIGATKRLPERGRLISQGQQRQSEQEKLANYSFHRTDDGQPVLLPNSILGVRACVPLSGIHESSK